MNLKKHSIPLIIVILFIVSLFLITVTASTIINANNTLNPDDINRYVEDTIDELTRYIKVQKVYGQFTTQKPFTLSKIAIMISPLFKNTIDLSSTIVQAQTTDSIHIYSFQNQVSILDDQSIFHQPLWNKLNHSSFGLISIIDKDQSLVNNHALSDTSDLAVLTIPVLNHTIQKGDYITITITAGDITQKTLSFSTPLPTKSVVDLW